MLKRRENMNFGSEKELFVLNSKEEMIKFFVPIFFELSIYYFSYFYYLNSISSFFLSLIKF